MNKITHEGEINLGNFIVPCYVLEDGRRVISGRGMQSCLKMVDDPVEEGKQTSGTRLSRYFNQESLKPFIYKDSPKDHFEPLTCYKGNTKINGYEVNVVYHIMPKPATFDCFCVFIGCMLKKQNKAEEKMF